MITLRRVYDPGESGERYKVLVDRLWPGGFPKKRQDGTNG